VPGIEKELPHERNAKIAIRTLGEQNVSKLAGIPKIGKAVGGSSLSFDFPGESEPKLRLADEIERRIRKSNVFFKDGSMPAPLREPVPKDERIIPHPEQELEQGVLIG
jgi:hypothetical protein